jgi:hypothetical protein
MYAMYGCAPLFLTQIRWHYLTLPGSTPFRKGAKGFISVCGR